MLVVECVDVRHGCGVYVRGRVAILVRAMSSSVAAPGMRVLGFPISVRPGFLLFMLLLVLVHGNEYGLWLAGAIAGFTLVHELGHAVVARRAGAADASISLDFMAGYASYSTAEPLPRRTQALIAFAGPGIHIAVSSAVLVAMGANPFDVPTFHDSPAQAAIWWAGPVIGGFNLLPLVPLDGGHIVGNVVDRALPGKGAAIMVRVSIVVTIVAAVVLALSDRTRGFVIFVGLLLMMQLQELYADRADRAVSPFDDAARALRAGDSERARRVLVNGLRRPGPAPTVPHTLDDDDARRLVALLPEPIPSGNAWNEYVLANLLIRVGDHDRAARFAAESYARRPASLIAATVARAAAALGDQATAIAWLRAAADVGTADPGLATIIDRAPELATLRDHPEVVVIRSRLTTAA